jgi:hypothetical protein
MVTRTGSLQPSQVPIDVLTQLNAGIIETVNLAECLAVDFAVLMAQVVPELATVAQSRILPADGITKRMARDKYYLHIWTHPVSISWQLIHPILFGAGLPTFWPRLPIDPWPKD